MRRPGSTPGWCNETQEPEADGIDLAAAVRERTDCARSSGALQPLGSRLTEVRDAGLAFQVRVLRGPATKPRDAGEGPGFGGAGGGRRGPGASPASSPGPAGPAASPFLRPEPDLSVAELPPAHRCLLNKYPVVEGHLLVVTRNFEPQESPLTRADFAALGRVLAQLDWLAFYNAGPVAGGSQAHKHLQLVPPLGGAPGADAGGRCPLEPGIRADRLPFPHAVAPVPDPTDPDGLLALYSRLRGRARGPYNLLVTREWMLHVPRAREEWAGVSVNALGFAGALLVREEAGLARLREVGPVRVLRAVSDGAGEGESPETGGKQGG